MGLNQSSQKHLVTKDRCRLSVGQGNGGDGEVDGDMQITDEQRGTITELNQQTLIQLVEEHQGCNMSVGSNTDDNKTSYADKTLQQFGDQIDPSTCGLGYTCRKGLKPDSPNQDSFIVLKMDTCSIYGIFDGHGLKGHDISNFVKENLPRLIVKDQRFNDPQQRKALLQDVFKKMQGTILVANQMGKFKADLSGTTATVAIHDHKTNFITIAHVADSTAVVAKKRQGQKDLTGEALTKDHKPHLKEERQRIEKSGGHVVFDGYANYRIYAKNAQYPGLNMSRCLGDLLGHQDCGIIADPDVVEFEVTQDMKWLMLCSNGVWEFITASEAARIVGELPPSKAMQGAETLAKEAWDRWIKEEGGAVVDDITAVLVALNFEK